MDAISEALRLHHSEKLSWHGPYPEGVDWSLDETKMRSALLNVVTSCENRPSLLGAVCYAINLNVDLD